MINDSYKLTFFSSYLTTDSFLSFVLLFKEFDKLKCSILHSGKLSIKSVKNLTSNLLYDISSSIRFEPL